MVDFIFTLTDYVITPNVKKIMKAKFRLKGENISQRLWFGLLFVEISINSKNGHLDLVLTNADYPMQWKGMVEAFVKVHQVLK